MKVNPLQLALRQASVHIERLQRDLTAWQGAALTALIAYDKCHHELQSTPELTTAMQAMYELGLQHGLIERQSPGTVAAHDALRDIQRFANEGLVNVTRKPE